MGTRWATPRKSILGRRRPRSEQQVAVAGTSRYYCGIANEARTVVHGCAVGGLFHPLLCRRACWEIYALCDGGTDTIELGANGTYSHTYAAKSDMWLITRTHGHWKNYRRGRLLCSIILIFCSKKMSAGAVLITICQLIDRSEPFI